MSEPDPFIIETLERILAAEWDVSAAGAGGDRETAGLWSAIEDTGLPLAWVDEALGGGGFSLADGFGIARVAARYAAPVPLAETLLAGWVLEQAGIAMPQGAMSVAMQGVHGRAELDDAGAVSGRFDRISMPSVVEHLVVVNEEGPGIAVALVPAHSARICDEPVGGAPFGHVDLTSSPAARSGVAATVSSDHVVQLGAVVRALQIAGALEHILGRTVGYANERKQFGRAISKFQAVQHGLARLAGEVAAAVAASGAAAAAVEHYGLGDARTLFAVASAKVRCGQAASEGAAIAHQVHGAIGFAAEYPLHLFTKNLWFWRDDFGSETEWAERLGELVAAKGADDYWAMLTNV